MASVLPMFNVSNWQTIEDVVTFRYECQFTAYADDNTPKTLGLVSSQYSADQVVIYLCDAFSKI